jgi:predicted 2-oxoglutarate/Fe(II)-dependent dioxygenase YbiX
MTPYPGTSVHRVTPITRGVRFAGVYHNLLRAWADS